eukprot:12247924-Ditylum_brightwellii.AAC.1
MKRNACATKAAGDLEKHKGQPRDSATMYIPKVVPIAASKAPAPADPPSLDASVLNLQRTRT